MLAIKRVAPSAGSRTVREETMRITTMDTGLYRIRLPVALSDSTHGTITHFELITVRLRDSDGAEGVGYTYTVGAGGSAVAALLRDGLHDVVVGADAELIEAL
jgi:L-alanine-DL-glutamate epimerase-like enolase superfamily enzyme